MKRSIWTAALVAVMAAAAAAQDRPRSTDSRLLERLDRMAKILDDEDLSEDLREEMQDLMEMLREQLSEGRREFDGAAELYRKAAGDALRGLDLGDLRGQLQGLRELRDVEGVKALAEGLDLSELRGQLQGVAELRNLDALKALQGAGELEFTKISEMLDDARGNLSRSADALDYAKIIGQLRDQDVDIGATLERVSEALQKTREYVDDDTVEQILESVRESLQDVPSLNYNRARNLYRDLADDVSRGVYRFQDQEGEWRKIVEEARKDWQQYADQAREQWREVMEDSRKDLDEQIKRAMEQYMKALERRKDGDDEPLVWPSPDGKVFSVTAPDNWSFSTEGGDGLWTVEGEAGEPKLFWSRADEGEAKVYQFKPSDEGGFFTVDEGKVEWFKAAPTDQGGSTFWRVDDQGKAGSFNFQYGGESEFYFSFPDGGKTGVYNLKPSGERGDFYFSFPDGGKAGVYQFDTKGGNFIFQPLKDGEGGVYFTPTEKKDAEDKPNVKVGIRAEAGDEEPAASFLESFRRDMSRRSGREVQDPEEIVELQEITEVELVEEPLAELLIEGPMAELVIEEPLAELVIEEPTAEFELVEPVLLETREPRVTTEDINEQIRDMVDELRQEMQEIRALVKALREKAKNQPR